MSRILLLLLFLLWMAWQPEGKVPSRDELWPGVAAFLAFYALLILVMGLWSRLLARRIAPQNLYRSLHRFNFMVLVARVMIPVWFALGVYVLNWGPAVQRMLGGASAASPAGDGQLALHLPSVLLGTLPALAAWAGLWWSQFPADRALREQNILAQLEADLPLHAPPGFWSYFTSNLRLQLLFTVVPILLILFLRDVAMVGVKAWVASYPASGSWLGASAAGDFTNLLDAVVSIGSTTLVFVFAPEILRRVLHTEPLPDSPLRRRLEALCHRSGIRYRDILLWRTQNNMGNAAVMGVVPWVRYVLLSDLLLESMSDEQIEAVFAHEIGHVVHRHLIWLAIAIVILALASAGPGDRIDRGLQSLHLPLWAPSLRPLLVLAGTGLFVAVFGFLSRHFERQADVFAARTIESGRSLGADFTVGILRIATPNLQQAPGRSSVGPVGAAVVASALHRVARVNNIPVKRWELLHGSIDSRMRYLHALSSDPARTTRFDHFMTGLYCTLLFLLFICSYSTVVFSSAK